MLRVGLLALVVICFTMTATTPARGVEKETVLALAKNLKSKDVNARLKAADDLSKLGADAKIASKELCDAVLDPNAKVALGAFKALEQVRPDLYKPLAKVMLDSSTDVRVEGLQELANLGEEAKPVAFVISTNLTKIVGGSGNGGINDVQKIPAQAYKTLVEIRADDPEVTKHLKAIAGPTTKHFGHRYFALVCLVSWAGEDEARRKELVPFIKAGLEAQGGNDAFIPFAVAYGPLSGSCLPALKKLKLAGDAGVREAATKAVETIEGALEKK